MRKTTFTNLLLFLFFLLCFDSVMGQNYVPFVPRYDEAIKGDMLLIGNSNIGVHRANPYSGTNNNESNTNRDSMVYVDIDSDSNTFNSSSADLDVPNDVSCYKIVYAGLYWSSVVKGNTPMANVKFKTPENSNYIDIIGTQIYYQNSSDNRNSDTFVYYKDVTSILTALTNPEGTYTVANISSNTSAMMTKGRNTEGLSAGWSLFVIYEDPLLPSKYITSFEGFTKIDNAAPNNQQSFNISGFKTIPVGPVNAKYAFSALEGDRGWSGDYLEINGTKISATTAGGTIIRPNNNFFNSTVSIIDPVTNRPKLFTERNPTSTNTLGFDAGIISIPNASNKVIANGDTSATIKLGTNTDIYYFYFSAFAIDIIAPKIVLTKIVEDTAGNDIGGQLVDLGDELNYVIGFKNTGNDNATDLIIRDILPINIVFNYPADIVSLPSGVNVQSYNPTTREIIFRINKSVVEVDDPLLEIRFKVTVVKTCSLLTDACSNIISNQAYATYKGTINPTFTISDDPSFNTNTGCLLTPGATNFLADLNCTFKESVILCGASTVLTAGNGYDSYSWSTSPTGTPVIGTSQSITVTNIGTYYVRNTAIAPCQSTKQEFTVITYGVNSTNPVIPFADEVVTCPNDGKKLPNIFLCGANDSRFIQTNITDTSSIIWEKLNEASCSAVPIKNCANEDTSCAWNQVATGPNFKADTAGQYRLTLNYTGGCFSQFYFNVYQNLLVPTVTYRDIFCTVPGQITVGSVPSGYEYSIDGVNYQLSNVFTINTPKIYSVYVRQIDVTPNPCIFSVPDVQIRKRDFTVSTAVTQPLCHDEKGSVKLAANDVRPQYFYSISQGATLINSVGPIMESDYTFANLNPGTYTATISTEDGCTDTVDFSIINPPLLTATSALTKPLTCTDGEITVYPDGGTPPYYYFVNSTTDFEGSPIITVTAPGVYNITVVDSNNCSAETSITVSAIPVPDFTVNKMDILCANSNDGSITINVANANGYTIQYSIDGGVTYGSNPTFSNLAPGTYSVNIESSLGGEVCFGTAQDVVITQPANGLTASAGVSELAGCGPSGAGRVRITNPQGGTAPYEYSFDNQASWSIVNEAYVAPGIYTLYIKDANGCIYPMPGIILDPEPVAPTISVSDPDFNCDGDANATVTVTNSGTGSFTYTYLLNGVENTNTANPKVFLNVPSGTHTISVEYGLSTVPTYSNLLYETFGYGDDTTSPGINTTYYCFERQVEATKCNSTIQINDGEYSVTSRIVSPFGTWLNPVDHTPPTNPVTPKGRYLVVNIGDQIPVTAVLYEKVINDIIPNQPINVEFFAMNLIKSTSNIYDPNLLVALVDASGTEISSFVTGDIPKSEKWEAYPKTPMTLNPGSNTSLKFIVRSNVRQTNGNDVAIDDIKVYQLPKTCTTKVDFPFIVASGNIFTAAITGSSNVSCIAAADGTITISAQNFDPAKGFQYSIDNGATWTTQMTSPYSITGLAANTYNIQVRYEDDLDTCNIPLSQQITEPAPIVVNVSATPITCDDGSTVKVKATGGSPAYSYDLLDASSILINSFPSNGILTNVPAGNYIIRVTDSNGCTATTTLDLMGATPPTASITNADYCYGDLNGATLEVTASGGYPPYQYSINGSAFQTSHIFNNLIPGDYNITVKDTYGCVVVLPTETIAKQIVVSTILKKDLDCTTSPDAIITGTFSGGAAPFTYAVSINGTAYSSLGTTTSPFTYTTLDSGTYQFRVTDANGCTAESGVETVYAISLPEISSVSSTPNLCYGEFNGAIQVAINNAVGTPPFVININNDTTGINYGSQTSGLPAGTYTITLTDSKFCQDIKIITIVEPSPIIVNHHTVDITCSALGVSKGSVIIDGVTGGTAPYNYFVTGTNGYSALELNSSGTTSITFDIVDFGLYQINVVDANGCSILIQDVKVASPPDDLDISIAATVDCTTGGEAVVVIGTTLVSSGPFFFDIYKGFVPASPPGGTWLAEDSPGSQSATFTGLIPGVTYTFIVYDSSTGCSYFETALVPVPTNSSLTANTLTSNNISCVGSADGNVSFTVNSIYSVTTTISYEIWDALSTTSTGINGSGIVPANGSLPVNNLGPLPYGNYFVLITETSGVNAGCGVITMPFNITESAIDLNISASVTKNANCNPNSGVITAIAKNGTAPYMYQLTTSATPPLAADAAWASTSVFNRDAGSYYVHVKDAYGCIKTIPAALDLQIDPIPTITATLNNQCTVTEGHFSIDVALLSPGIAPHSYSINRGAFQTRTAPFTISNLVSGTHTIEVKDANGCGELRTVDIVPPVDLSADIMALPSCNDDDGEITVSAVGGTGVYTYSISPNPISIILNGNEFTGVPSGTYTITVEDTTTGCTKDVTIALDQATPVTFTATPTDVSCNGGSDGIITVTLPVSNDNPIYTYEITAGPILRVSQTSKVFSGLEAGLYTVLVTSGRGCTFSEDITVGEPDLIVVAAPVVIDYDCTTGANSSNFATITVNSITGGSGNYTNYEFIRSGIVVQSGSKNVYTETDFLGGIYTINVYDDNGCVGTTTAPIQPFVSLDALTVTIDSAITCTNDEDITVLVTSSGGTPNLEFILEDFAAILPTQTNTTGVFTALPIGNYIITVRNVDTECTLQTVHYVNEPNTFDLTIDSVIDVTCFSDSDGSVNVTFIDRVPTPTDESGPFSYNITDVSGNTVTSGSAPDAGPVTISNLASGTYTITATLTSSPYCAVSKNFTITAPTVALSVVETHTEITCVSGYNDGTISASATGGWPGGYEFALSGAASVAYSPNSMFTNLSAGIYTISVKDSRGCIATETVELTNPLPIVITASANKTLLTCFGDTDATISVNTVSGGQGSNYSYTLNMISPTVSSSGPQLTPVFSGLGAGTYSITVTDGYNCSATSAVIVIAQPTPIEASLVAATTTTCIVEATLTLSATGGTAPYSYSASSTFANILGTFTGSETFQVSPGTYQYYVRDANGCVAVVSNEITIDPLPALVVNLEGTNLTINCAGDNTGVIVATAQGGLGSYVYTLQNGSGVTIPGAIQNSPGVFTELPSGTYQVRVDSGDCLTTSAQVTITEPSAPLIADFITANITCPGENNGRLEITASGGTGTIKYAISPRLDQFFNTSIFEKLTPGTYQAIAQDELGCYLLSDFTIIEPAPVVLSIVPNSIIPEVCTGDMNGEFSIEISGGNLPYSVVLDDINGTYITGTATQTQFDFADLVGGDHVVYVRDALNCETEWNITFPKSVQIEAEVTVEFGCTNNTSTNMVTVTVKDKTVNLADLDYSLNGGMYQPSNIFIDVPSGTNHIITVRHTNGCEKPALSFDIEQYNPLTLVLDNGGLNEIVAVTTGGSGTYEYTLNGESYGSTNTFLIYESGTYTVTVTDSYGCFVSATKYFEFIDLCIPNYFTPNADGNQDEWGPGCASQYRNLTFNIFDRYGRKVATLSAGQKWDGKYNGVELPTGDYWYVVKLNDKKYDKEFVGHFTLYR